MQDSVFGLSFNSFVPAMKNHVEKVLIVHCGKHYMWNECFTPDNNYPIRRGAPIRDIKITLPSEYAYGYIREDAW